MKSGSQALQQHWQGPLFLILICCLLLALPACGFHLRGQQSAKFPAQLSEMRVQAPSSGTLLQADMERALVSQAGVRIVRGEAPAATLNIHEERSETRPAAVAQDVRVSEVLLRYEVEFDLADAAGKALLGRQSVTLQRALSYDRFNVLAQERQTQETLTQMRQDAVQQIIRRLAVISQP